MEEAGAGARWLLSAASADSCAGLANGAGGALTPVPTGAFAAGALLALG